MLFVMIIHFNLYSQEPYMICYFDSSTSMYANKGLLLAKHLIHSLTCVAVPCFILISGWFGINFKIRGVLKLYLQCIFCEALAYFAYILISGENIQSNTLINLFTFKDNNYWFLKGYFLLYLISPALNKIIDSLKDKWLVIFTILLIIPSFYLNHIGKQGGLMLFSIVYMIGRCLRRCSDNNWLLIKNGGGKKWLAMYILGSLFIFILAVFKLFLNINILDIYNEYNPLIILSAIGLLIFFLSLPIETNKIINKMSGSVFAAYIIQENHFFGYLLLYPSVGKILNNFNSITSMVLLFICSVSLLVICIFADILMKKAYNFVIRLYDIVYQQVTLDTDI